MKLFIVLSALCAVAFAYPSSSGWQQVKNPLEHPRYQKLLSTLYAQKNFESNPIRGGRIVGGQPAVLGQFPYQVYGYFDDMWLCGASIISENWLLTVSGMIAYWNVINNNSIGCTLHHRCIFHLRVRWKHWSTIHSTVRASRRRNFKYYPAFCVQWWFFGKWHLFDSHTVH